MNATGSSIFTRTTAPWKAQLLTGALILCQTHITTAQDESELTPIPSPDTEPAATIEEVIAEGEAIRVNDSTNENPEAARIAERQRQEGQTAPDEQAPSWELDLYGSVRLHAINTYNIEDDRTDHKLGDGASRIGVSGSWEIKENWDVFGRLESGFDVLDTFTSKGQGSDDGQIRLANIGLDSEHVYLKLGKSWSAYYTVAGAADRFAIFGGDATGAYNAGTDGGASGTGRADDSLQTNFYIDTKNWASIKPFNVNLQYSLGQPIPEVRGEDYDYNWGLSAWLENDSRVGVGLAYHRAAVENPEAAAVRAAGIEGDATAASIAFKSYGNKWLASLVLSKLDYIETTDRNLYFRGKGAELFAQWQFARDFWLVGGGNWLIPDDDQTLAGDYQVKYGVVGVHYSIDSFNRMLYVEWKDDHSRLTDGRSLKNEFTLGIRWDLGYE